jgi:16S rRNA G527 N7-methylase RsmG
MDTPAELPVIRFTEEHKQDLEMYHKALESWGKTCTKLTRTETQRDTLKVALKDAIEALSWYAEEKHQVAINALDAARDALSSATKT